MIGCRHLPRLGATVLLLSAPFVSTPAAAKTGDRLDRSHLVRTFEEACRAPGLEKRFKTQFTSGVQSGYGSDSSRTLSGNHEAQIYVDPAYQGRLNPDPKTGYVPPALGLQPFGAGRDVCAITASPAPASIRSGAAGFDGKYAYTSGLLTTEGRFSQTYGYFEITLRVPAVRGTWPAFWLLPVDRSWPPELDVVEILGHDPATAYFTVHPGAPGHPVRTADPSRRPVTYGVLWGPATTTWYVDDVEVYSQPTPAAMNKPMYLLVDLAVGGPGSWPGPPDAAGRFPATLRFNGLRAYRVVTAPVHGGGIPLTPRRGLAKGGSPQI